MSISVDYGLTASYLRTLFRLDTDGVLWHRHWPVSMFEDTATRTAQHNCNLRNSKYAGKEVNPGASLYKRTPVLCPDGSKHFVAVHNIIECIRTGKWPKYEVDHANGDTLDNSQGNHRLATRTQQMQNMGLRSDNTSGVPGVHQYKRSGKCYAYIKPKGMSRIQLYYGDSFEDAVAARKAGELRYFGKYRRKT